MAHTFLCCLLLACYTSSVQPASITTASTGDMHIDTTGPNTTVFVNGRDVVLQAGCCAMAGSLASTIAQLSMALNASSSTITAQQSTITAQLTVNSQLSSALNSSLSTIALQQALLSVSSNESEYVLTPNFVSSSTPGNFDYTPSVGMVYCVIEIVGGGGVGDGYQGNGAGGGAGGYARGVFTPSSIGKSVTFMIGSGGNKTQSGTATTMSNNAMWTNPGGRAVAGVGGPGGTASGPFAMSGADGGNTLSDSNTAGNGAPSYFGPGGQAGRFTGGNARAWGGGGGGISDANYCCGGNGANGAVVITEYIRQQLTSP